MNNATPMRVIERAANLGEQKTNVLQGGRAPLFKREAHSLSKRTAAQQAHDHIAHALKRAIIIDRDDVRMFQSRGGLCLAVEAFQIIRLLCQCRGQDLDRDESIQVKLTGAVDRPHAADT